MKGRLNQLVDSLRTGFWFVPSAMLFLAAGLALLLLHVDGRFDPGITSSIGWAYSGGPEGARSLLSTIAGSMITAASVTFSLASVALSIASQQYGSRVLRNFMRDRITQVLLGTFVSTFIYSVLVVRSIRGSDYSGFVPAIATTVAIVLSLISLLMLIYFVHHVSTSIQASHIVKVISDDMQSAIPRLYPSEVGVPFERTPHSADFRSRTMAALRIRESGYLETIDLASILSHAQNEDWVVEILLKPGDHIVSGEEVAHVWSQAVLAQEELDEICSAFVVAGQRTPSQDIRYQFQQLTDVVVRALSPGINDPFTAMNGIDELAGGLSLLAKRPRVQEWREDREGALRVLIPRPQINEILRDTLGHIVIYAAGDSFVMNRLRRVLTIIDPDLRTNAEREESKSLRIEFDRREASKNSGLRAS